MSFSTCGYNDQQMDHSCLDTRLTTIEETQQDICNTLHQHSQWWANMGDVIINIQQNQQQENENLNFLFQRLNFDPPY